MSCRGAAKPLPRLPQLAPMLDCTALPLQVAREEIHDVAGGQLHRAGTCCATGSTVLQRSPTCAGSIRSLRSRPCMLCTSPAQWLGSLFSPLCSPGCHLPAPSARSAPAAYQALPARHNGGRAVGQGKEGRACTAAGHCCPRPRPGVQE